VDVPLGRLLFAVHDMSWVDVERWARTPQPWPLVLVEQLDTGHLFVHDGRHRATAAYELGHSSVACRPV
jgi:CxxC motif-containing protein (DUF1111 family)